MVSGSGGCPERLNLAAFAFRKVNATRRKIVCLAMPVQNVHLFR